MLWMRPTASCFGRTRSVKERVELLRLRQLSGRGLAYWTDGTEERILYVTPGYRLVNAGCKDGASRSLLSDRRAIDLKNR